MRTYRYKLMMYSICIDCQYINNFLFTGGVPGNIRTETGGVYHTGLSGCVLQLQAATAANQWTAVHLQQAATQGIGITPCQIS